MVTKILMPRLSLTMERGEVSHWYRSEGDVVEKGEPLVEVFSEKVTYDVEAPVSGVLRKILVADGAEVPVTEVLGIIAAPGEELPPELVIGVDVEEVEEPSEKRVLASPAAKRLAREHGVDLRQVSLIKEGRITEEDVRRFIEKAGPQVGEVIPLTGLRRSVAERMSSSARMIPQCTITMEVEMTNTIKLHEELRYSYDAIVASSVAKALGEFPILNSTLRDDVIQVFKEINIGVAIATDKGLVVPVVHRADKLALSEISNSLKEIVVKAKAGKLVKEELSSGTFTVSNLGMFGVDTFTPIINPPEAAILGVGRMVEKPVVIDGQIETKPVCYLSLTFDHRIVDGVPAAQFLKRVKHFLEHETNG